MDPEEFRLWYETVAADLRRYVDRICDTAEESEDVFQESFTRLLGSDFVSNDPVERRRYLFRIATNLVRDRRRWTQRWRLQPVPERVGNSPEEGYAGRIDAQRALSRLSPRARALLWLAYANGFPHKEIAEIIGIASTSVRVLLARARKRFLDGLERSEP